MEASGGRSSHHDNSGDVVGVGGDGAGEINAAFNVDEGMPKLILPESQDRKISVLDSAPHMDHYKIGVDKMRPSLHELHQSGKQQEWQGTSPVVLNSFQFPKVHNFKQVLSSSDDVVLPKITSPAPAPDVIKFGWIIGVLIRCSLSILSGMLYMRISWVAGQAGLGLGSLIILLSSLVAVLTCLSMCAICTNGEVRGGGAYFMISRSLGPEFGGSVGIVFSLANVLNAGLNIAAFAETCKDVIKEHGAKIVDGGSNDMRIIGCCVLVLLACVVLVGVDFEVKAQVVLLVILSASFVDYVAGTFIPPSLKQQSQGFTGYSWNLLTANFGPQFRHETFFGVFAVYFPAATGIMAGANISGNLRNPSRDIPKGTLLAILVTTGIYLSALWMVGSSVERDASGEIGADSTIIPCSPALNLTTTCDFGLINHFQTMQMQSAFGPLIIAGIFAATLSSALSCLISGPRLFQAVCRDKLYPKIEWFAKSYGRTDEPKRAYILCFIICLGIVLIADVNSIAPYSSNFYLATYALINYACFHASTIKATGWRPSFKFYNKWLSLLGAALCIAGMFLMSYIGAICTAMFILVLYVYLLLKKPDVNWGTSRQAEIYKMALENSIKLLYTEEHVKNYTPAILVLTGNPIVRPPLVDFVRSMTKQKGLMLLGHVIFQQPDSQYNKCIKIWRTELYEWLKKRKAKGFYCPLTANNLLIGLQTLLQVAGLGKLAPNMVLVGFKHNWTTSSANDIWQYFQLIHAALSWEMSIGILKVDDGLDYSSVMLEDRGVIDEDLQEKSAAQEETAPRGSAVRRLSQVPEENEGSLESDNRTASYSSLPTLTEVLSARCQYDISGKMAPAPSQLGAFNQKVRKMSLLDTQIFLKINQFQFRPKQPIVHVYWLYDDGGLTLLFPHIFVTNKTFLFGAKVRIFMVASGNVSPEEDEKHIREMLEKFRIQYAEITVICDMDKEPAESTVQEFERLIDPFRISQSNDSLRHSMDSSIYISDTELIRLQKKTKMHLRTRELLLEHSKETSLIVITQPIPRKGGISACLYLAWLNFLSKDLSPVFFVRGNQQDVLTFYS